MVHVFPRFPHESETACLLPGCELSGDGDVPASHLGDNEMLGTEEGAAGSSQTISCQINNQCISNYMRLSNLHDWTDNPKYPWVLVACHMLVLVAGSDHRMMCKSKPKKQCHSLISPESHPSSLVFVAGRFGR